MLERLAVHCAGLALTVGGFLLRLLPVRDSYEDIGRELLTRVFLLSAARRVPLGSTLRELEREFPEKSRTAIKHHVLRLVDDGLLRVESGGRYQVTDTGRGVAVAAITLRLETP